MYLYNKEGSLYLEEYNMSQKTISAFSAFIYEVGNKYMADCSMYSLVTEGNTPDEALNNLKHELKLNFKDSDIRVNPVFEKR